MKLPSYISHTFSNILGTSFPEYINTLRINEAIRLLTETEYSVTEIAARSGYTTTRNFHGVFTKHMGLSPSAYRASK